MNVKRRPPHPPSRPINLSLPDLKYGAVFGYVLSMQELADYADKHQIALNDPPSSRRDKSFDHMIRRTIEQGVFSTITIVFRGPKMTDGMATCIYIGSNHSSKWKQFLQNGRAKEMSDKMKEAIGCTYDPQWYNKVDI